MAKMGRPRKKIDKTEFEKLCAMQCSLEEICGWFDVCADTMEDWCRREYGATFSKVFAVKRAGGKIALRRNQFKLAEKYPNMAIWLGKQYLGQTEHPVIQIAVSDDKKDPITAALLATVEAINNGNVGEAMANNDLPADEL